MSISDDDFDKLSDPFAGIDWNTVPELSTPPRSNHPTSGRSPTLVESRPSTPLASGEDCIPPPSQYSYDEIDAAFLAEVDKIERRLLQPQVLRLGDTCDDRGEGPSTYSNTGSELKSRYFHEWHVEEDPPSLQTIVAHEWVTSHATSSGDDSLPNLEQEVKSTKMHKGKQKESPSKILKEFLDNLEDEMICPICCDIFAFAHLGNPCGHTFCGECGWRWIKKNREAPSCAICRAGLSLDAPMIPNFAVDSAVEKHVQALRTNRIEGWLSAGAKFTEWEARKSRWKTGSAKLMARKNVKPTLAVMVVPNALGGSSPNGSDYVEEEAGSSGGRSRSRISEREEVVAVRREQTNRRRAHHYHHQRRSGGNRGNRVEHDGGRGGSGPRARRSMRRRRD